MESQTCVKWGQRQYIGYVNYYVHVNAMKVCEQLAQYVNISK